MSESNSNEITDFEVTGLTNSKYINPYRISFQQNNFKRVWDGVSDF